MAFPLIGLTEVQHSTPQDVEYGEPKEQEPSTMLQRHALLFAAILTLSAAVGAAEAPKAGRPFRSHWRPAPWPRA